MRSESISATVPTTYTCIRSGWTLLFDCWIPSGYNIILQNQNTTGLQSVVKISYTERPYSRIGVKIFVWFKTIFQTLTEHDTGRARSDLKQRSRTHRTWCVLSDVWYMDMWYRWTILPTGISVVKPLLSRTIRLLGLDLKKRCWYNMLIRKE